MCPAAEHEVGERLGRLPHGQVHNQPVVVEDPDRGRVAVLGLEPPDEAGASVGQRIERSELRAKTVHRRIVDWRAQSSDIHLRQMEARHVLSSYRDRVGSMPLFLIAGAAWSDARNAIRRRHDSGSRAPVTSAAENTDTY